MIASNVKVRVKRQDGPDKPARWEDFEVPFRRGMNVITLLHGDPEEPRHHVGPEGGAGGVGLSLPRRGLRRLHHDHQRAAAAKPAARWSKNLEQPIKLEPMTKFPLVRDLSVDRSRMFDASEDA